MDYKGPRWTHKRAAILRRDSYWCQYCERYGRITEATTVHHIMPAEYFKEYQFESWNLTSLCTSCHNEMHDRDSHKLTRKGWELLQRTARRNNITIKNNMRQLLLAPEGKKAKAKRSGWSGTRY